MSRVAVYNDLLVNVVGRLESSRRVAPPSIHPQPTRVDPRRGASVEGTQHKPRVRHHSITS